MSFIYKKVKNIFQFLFSKHPDYYWKQMLIYMSILLIVVFIGNRFLINANLSTQEGFEQMKAFVLEIQEFSYDPFYAEIYDQLHPVSNHSVEQMIDYIEKETQPSIEQSLFLDVGCGTGKCLYQLQQSGYQVIGIDQSIAMIEEAKEICGSKTPFHNKNILSSPRIFEENTFSHILCLGPTTLYEICSPNANFMNLEASTVTHSNLDRFVIHAKKWLKRGGYLILQIEPLSTLSQSWISSTGGGKSSYSPKFPKRIYHPDSYTTEIRFSEVDYKLEMTPSVPFFPSTDSKGSFLGNDDTQTKIVTEDQQSTVKKPFSNIEIRKKPYTETVILKETFSNRKHPQVRQNEWHLTSPFSDTQDWIQAIQTHGFTLSKAAAIPYPSMATDTPSTHAPVPQIYLFQKI